MMRTITVYIPTEEELAQARMGLIRPTIDQVAASINRNLTRRAYGCAEGTIDIVFPRGRTSRG